jgi:SAM-dependent methyltransferase
VVSFFYRAAYLLGFKPWDSGVSPPELIEVVEGSEALPPGRALDLGCGTGTNSIYMGRHGWEVTGVDFVGRPIAQARRKAAGAGVSPNFIRGDVTRLDELGVGSGYGLLLDLGCLHGIPEDRRDAYARSITEAAAPGATYMLFAFLPSDRSFLPRGVDTDELMGRLGGGWELVWSRESTGRFRATWYRLRRRED